MARDQGSVLGNNRHGIATLLTIIFTRQKKDMTVPDNRR